MAYATVTLTGTYQTPDGTPHKGTVEVIPSEKVIKDTTGDVILTGRVKVRLGHPAAEGEAGAENGWVHDGKFTVALPATDDPTLNPTGFGYTLAAKLHSTHLPAVSFSLPAATPTVDVEDVTPVDPSTFEPTTTYAESSELAAVETRTTTLESEMVTKANSADVPTTAADVGALPNTTTLPDLPGIATDTQLPERLSEPGLNAAYAGRKSQRTTTSIRAAYVTTAANDGLLGFSATTGLAASGDSINAATPGTHGYGIVPLFATTGILSFRAKCTKATAGSSSVVGVSITSPGVLPTDSNRLFAFGYKQGVGLCWSRDNVSSDIVAVADSAITDGDEYDVTVVFDGAMTPDGSTPRNKAVSARWHKVGTAITADGYNRQFMREDYYDPGNLVARTNTTSALTRLTISIPTTGEIGHGPALLDGQYSSAANDPMIVHFPRKPNGLAVIALHGHGGGANETGWSSTVKRPIWERLAAVGYTVFVPTLGGQLWGNNQAMSLLVELRDAIVDVWGLDPEVFLWGDSMGGGAVLTAIGKQVLPVRAAYVTEPVADLSVLWANPSYSTLPDAYSNDTALRDANNPMLLPVENYANTPIMFAASPDDTAITKAEHTDPMLARLDGVTDTALFVNSGAHAAPEAYRPVDPATWFGSHV